MRDLANVTCYGCREEGSPEAQVSGQEGQEGKGKGDRTEQSEQGE
jgi:hypothetical protein